MRVKFSIDTGFVGGEIEEVLELPDGLDDTALDEAHMDWVHEQIDLNWERLDD